MTTALVTGASTGIGRVFAKKFAAQGHDVVVVARDEARLKELAIELSTDVEVLAADLTDQEDLARVEARIEDQSRPVEILVNNAGFGTFGTFAELDRDVEDREIRLNVLALTRLTHAAVQAMIPRKRGGIINVSSIAGFQPAPYGATYSATKAFVTSFTQGVHEEVKPHGVKVVALCPGFTRSEFQQRAGIRDNGGPAFLWQSPEEVVDVALEGLRRNQALTIPGAHNKAAALFSQMTPDSVKRKISGMAHKRFHEG
jgi:uncharacterized protein